MSNINNPDVNHDVSVNTSTITIYQPNASGTDQELIDVAIEHLTIDQLRVYARQNDEEVIETFEVYQRMDIPSYTGKRTELPDGTIKVEFEPCAFNRVLETTASNGQPEGVVEYPQSIIESIQRNLSRYSETYAMLVNRDRSFNDTPSAYEVGDSDEGNFINLGIQVDMAGLPKAILDIADQLSEAVLDQFILERVFEFENSLAMYNFMRLIFSDDDRNSTFRDVFDGLLQKTREVHGNKRIVIATLNEQKYEAIRTGELGLLPNDPDLDQSEIQERIGFDDVYSPQRLKDHLFTIKLIKEQIRDAEQNGDHELLPTLRSRLQEADNVIFYSRASLPVAKLGDPKVKIEFPEIVGDSELLDILRERSLTPNLDTPISRNYLLPLNDTKEYTELMDMMYVVRDYRDIFSEEVIEQIDANQLRKDRPANQDPLSWAIKTFVDVRNRSLNKGEVIDMTSILNPRFIGYLNRKGFEIKQGNLLRTKPLTESYGAYGHEQITLLTKTGGLSLAAINTILREVNARGPMAIQPEIIAPTLIYNYYSDGDVSVHSQLKLGYVDRLFFIWDPETKSYQFANGFRNCSDKNSPEGRKNNYHGQRYASYMELRQKNSQ